MNQPVVFNALWILSEKSASARHLTFSPGKNLLAGSNDTGKLSTITLRDGISS